MPDGGVRGRCAECDLQLGAQPERQHRVRPDHHHTHPGHQHAYPGYHHAQRAHPGHDYCYCPAIDSGRHPVGDNRNPDRFRCGERRVGSSLLWLWILLGALAVAGVIVLIVRSSGRRSAAAADWQSRVIDAYAKGSALYDAMSVAETPAALAAADAGARWSDIQRRADDLAQTLYALREAAPDEDARAGVADTLASLQAVRSALDAERAPGGAGPLHAQVVRDRMYAFEMALRALRSSGEPLS